MEDAREHENNHLRQRRRHTPTHKRRINVPLHKVIHRLIPTGPVASQVRAVPPIAVEFAVAEAEALGEQVQEALEEEEEPGEPADKADGAELEDALEDGEVGKRGDGGEAHEMSRQSKKHAAQADAYNKQASEFIFRENNAMGKVAGDTIDLHGQYVEEAEEILEQRIRYAKQTGQSHLHVIVGKGEIVEGNRR